jgi:hypothetical protein
VEAESTAARKIRESREGKLGNAEGAKLGRVIGDNLNLPADFVLAAAFGTAETRAARYPWADGISRTTWRKVKGFGREWSTFTQHALGDSERKETLRQVVLSCRLEQEAQKVPGHGMRQRVMGRPGRTAGG